jgi:hypothetical protein
LISSVVVLFAFLGYPAVRRIETSKSHRATRCAVVAISAGGQIPFLWACLLIWDRVPTENSELIPSVRTLESGSTTVRMVLLLAGVLMLIESFVQHQTEKSCVAERQECLALDEAIVERQAEAR